MAVRKRPVRKQLRSSFEERVVEQLQSLKASFEYEPTKITYQKKPSKYTPDILLSNGIFIEVKGYFDAEDRAKHILIKEQHPELDIRFVFQNSRKKIHKLSETTYGDWCDARGFKYADKEIPIEWIRERGSDKQLRSNRKPRLRGTTSKDISASKSA